MENSQMITDLIQEGDWMVKRIWRMPTLPCQSGRRIGNGWSSNGKGRLTSSHVSNMAYQLLLECSSNSQTSCGLDETLCMSDHNIHKRQFAASTIKRESPGTGQTDGGLIWGPGFLRELQEFCVGPPAINGVSGVLYQFQINAIAFQVKKLGRIHTNGRSLLPLTLIRGRELTQFIGRANSVTLAPLFYKNLQGAKHATLTHIQGLDSAISVPN